MLTDSGWFVFLLVVPLVWLVWAWRCRQHLRGHTAVVAAHVQQLLKPRTPDDCPACCQHVATSVGNAPAPPPLTPWSAVKSRRGAPKHIDTQGFACPNHACTYYQITDAHIHALVGDGTHGRCERIQTLRCQACATSFSTRRDTPLYRLKATSQRVGEVLTALAEGLDVSAAARVFGHRHATITRWLVRAGMHSATLHDRVLRNLHLPHLQLDEIRTRLRNRAHTLWLWLAIDPLSKLVPTLHLGTRTQAAAHAVVHDLRQRLAPSCLPVFTSDGLNLYFYALTAHFGQWIQDVGRRARAWQVAIGLIYGQVKKRYRRQRLVGITYIMRCGTRLALRDALLRLGLSGKLNTAFVERLNLTVRQSLAALMRRTWSTMHQAPQLLLHLEWWRGYYHFVRLHESLRVPLAQPIDRGGRRRPQRYRQRRPAMAAGLTGRRWTVQELLMVPLPPAPIGAG
jgi:IS1 family transposase